ncbi:MAG: NADH-quinone oxidoreductase subunit M [Verrucomicrobia subdivision 3 bacterium]|nr:NADH-quinone oxidoreductase subunit M [Limisphaerales bacterium]
MNDFPEITVMTLLPVLGAIFIAGIDDERSPWPRRIGLGFSVLALLMAVCIWVRFDPANPELQFVEDHEWIPSMGVKYFVGIDGLGLLMAGLTALVIPFALLTTGRDVERPRAFYSLMLLLQAGLFGAFTALNFVHWFVFWELSLVPAYFLIKLWGGPNRTAAATQFFLYTLVGSVTMLLGFMAIFLSTGSFDFIALAEKARGVRDGLGAYFEVKLGWYELSSRSLAMLIFLGVFLGFAVKVPLFPFHTWLPSAYAEAPSSVTMVLTGVMSKMGVYGLLRILMPLFPEQMRWGLDLLLWLAVATIVFSAFAAFSQNDLKRVMAYSSINHLGYCLLGIFAAVKWTQNEPGWVSEKAAALNGVLLQMFNHGITAAALFCFIAFIERRAGRRGLEDFGGLRKVAPVFCGLMGISMFASLGLPGLNGFVGEFLIFKGAFALASWAAALSTVGLLVTAIFLLTVMQRVFHGPLNANWGGFADLTLRERSVAAPAILLMFVIGIYPQWLLDIANPAVMQLIAHLAN